MFMTFCRTSSEAGPGEIRSEVEKTRSLCPQCAEAEYTPEMRARIEAGCRYCGQKGVGSVCPRCLREYRRFLASKGITFPLTQSQTQEEIAATGMAFLELEAHMTRWVKERGPEGPGEAAGPAPLPGS